MKGKRRLLNYCSKCDDKTEHNKEKIYSKPFGQYLGTQWKCKVCGTINKSFRK